MSEVKSEPKEANTHNNNVNNGDNDNDIYLVGNNNVETTENQNNAAESLNNVNDEVRRKVDELVNEVNNLKEVKNETVNQSDVVTSNLTPTIQASALVPNNEQPEHDDAKAVVYDSGARKEEMIYSVKWIEFNNKIVPIILQNENGPCPLIAIANILFLRQYLKLKANTEYITSNELISSIGDTLFKFIPEGSTQIDDLNFQKNLNDALTLFDRLQYGLDVNVKFNGVDQFEYTNELNIFDIFRIKLYHGWLIDPQQTDIASIVQNLSYNQLVEKIIYLKNSDSQIEIAQGILIEDFLESTQSQLTYYGLIELQEALKENELAVFFRNNHFNTIYKRNVSKLVR